MRSRANSIGLRRAALFVALAAAVAAIVVVAGRELGWGGPAAQGQGGPAMTLSLSAAPTCETGRGQGYAGSELRDRDDGTTERYSVFAGYFGIAETDVNWSVSGGTAPYTLEIDGETRDATHSYSGATGTASVSCALDPGETFIDPDDGRGYLSNPPKVDSGVKTIRASVTDANGATAEAAIDIYVILSVGGGGVILEPGKTYRLHGHLITIPQGYPVTIGAMVEPNCVGDVVCETSIALMIEGDDWKGFIGFGIPSGTEYGRGIRKKGQEGWLEGQYIQPGERGVRGASSHPGHAAFDQLMSSVGQAPQIDRD